MRLRTGFAAVGILLGLALLSACSGKSDNSTTGPPPGGGLELNSGNIGSGGTFPHTFMTAGTFGYHCTIHSGMTGSVTVQSGGPATAAVTIASNAFSPPSVTVGVGGTVTWTNNDGFAHTVTSH